MKLPVCLLALLLTLPAVGGESEEASTAVRIMSFNVRYGTARDGENHWEKRKDLLIGTIQAFAPDLLGTQEALAFQRDSLAAALPDHAVLGVGREDGRDQGEMTAVYYRRGRFDLLASGHFWLSETPDQPGSKSWDSSLPRMATWVRLRDRRAPAALPVLFINTHFDHQGAQARLESARLLRTRLETAASSNRVVVTGDFNAGEGSPPYLALFGAGPGADAGAVLRDSWRLAHPQPVAAEGTFNGFQVTAASGARIDWIGVSRGWRVDSAAIDHTARDGRTPSDHFPITAILIPE
jgi:endonuclease/exonuclease/phosphatase family metal-dependent hydrolase